MLAYNNQLLENTFVIAEAESLQQAAFISKEQNDFIDSKLPALQTQSNVLIRAGLFILGCFLFSSCCGMFALIASGLMTNHYAWIMLLNTIFGFFAIEFIIRDRKYFGNGIDDAFIVCTQLTLAGWVGVSIGDINLLTPVFMAMIVAGIFCCIRYADSLAAFFACVGLTCLAGDLSLKGGDIFKSFLPFIMMALAAVIYLVSGWLKKENAENSFYTKSINVCYGFSISLFYLSGNYLVVREGNEMLLHAEVGPGTDIRLAWLFYTFTMMVPVLYIYFSLLRKDRIMLWVGWFAFAFSIFTIRYYDHIIPAEWDLLIGGLILLAVVLVSIRKLKGRTSGLTFEADRLAKPDKILKAEYIFIAQNYGVKPVASDTTGPTFGGGDFGGGGAGNSF